eukprot:TRINITY_DN39789_c0_g1_i1.p1 TRINITY_DN39789_c0_g1~~TRINITY_DN39789_c0_g1_i1.p1  ORF type:complete len:834 (-),score=164.89 TRINITY_DN39789_c0_g1_i1:21-2522(-)
MSEPLKLRAGTADMAPVSDADFVAATKEIPRGNMVPCSEPLIGSAELDSPADTSMEMRPHTAPANTVVKSSPARSELGLLESSLGFRPAAPPRKLRGMQKTGEAANMVAPIRKVLCVDAEVQTTEQDVENPTEPPEKDSGEFRHYLEALADEVHAVLEASTRQVIDILSQDSTFEGSRRARKVDSQEPARPPAATALCLPASALPPTVEAEPCKPTRASAGEAALPAKAPDNSELDVPLATPELPPGQASLDAPSSTERSDSQLSSLSKVKEPVVDFLQALTSSPPNAPKKKALLQPPAPQMLSSPATPTSGVLSILPGSVGEQGTCETAPEIPPLESSDEEDESGTQLKASKRETSRAKFGLKTSGGQFKARRTFQAKLPSAAEEGGRQTRRSILFGDPDMMKMRLRASLYTPEYNIQDFYKDEGCCQWIARSAVFDYASLAVVGLNAIWIMIEMDHNKEAILFEADAIFIIVENLFAVFFFSEFIIRLFALEHWKRFLQDNAMIFDFFLVLLMVLEVWLLAPILYFSESNREGGQAVGNVAVLRIFRLMRLTRVARMGRILRAVPELMVLIKGIMTASRSVCFTMGLLGIVTYVFAICFAEITAGSPLGSTHYDTVPTAMLSLFLEGALPDVADLVYRNSGENAFFGIVTLVYVLIACLTILNMLVGILVEVVGVVARHEKEESEVKQVRTQLLKLLQEHCHAHVDETSEVDQDTFLKIVSSSKGARSIHELGVDVFGLIDLRELIFAEGGIQFGDFMEIILQLRGSNQATVKDIVDLRKFILQEIEDMQREQFEAINFVKTSLTKNTFHTVAKAARQLSKASSRASKNSK